ncbi:MAG: translation elongation factor-like protein [Candidatus Micrarchaeia archaeon]
MEGEEKEVGKILHYYDKIGVAIVQVSDNIKKGDRISIRGKKTNFEQVVQSMQLEHIDIDEATKGKEVGLKVDQPVREGDKVYKLL